MRFLHVRLEAPAARIEALSDFYGRTLGFELTTRAKGRLSFPIGETVLELVAAAGAPFYHFALLVPGDRFDAALDWAGGRTELLPRPDSDDPVFDFDTWAACACYFHDPAGNIVELIAHRGVDQSGARGDFRAVELAGLSELGLVGDPRALAGLLAGRLGLELWDGTVDEPGRLGFVGERGRTLILSPPGRGWLPTGRAAEPHAVDATLAARRVGEVELEDGLYRIRSRTHSLSMSSAAR